jgi:hypothetical protein
MNYFTSQMNQEDFINNGNHRHQNPSQHPNPNGQVQHLIRQAPQSLLPVPRRENPELHRLPQNQHLPLLWLRQKRRYH